MKSILPTLSPSLPRNEGQVLVLTLCLIVLITLVAVAVFARSATNTIIENVRAAQVISAQISESAADHAIAEFLGEIVDSSVTVTNEEGLVNYMPLTATSMLPSCRLALPFMQTNDDFINLTRQSIASADSMASSDNSAAPSRDGRSVDASRWSAPKLVIGDFSSASQLPCWIYINGDGSLTNSASGNSIGRFAYNAYDIGGLLDVNVAGHPNFIWNAADLSVLKGTLAGADLALIPGVTDINAFVSWRNPSSSASSAAYVAAVVNAAANGFTGIASGDRGFTSRQDLIRFANLGSYGISSDALPYLTHFTRELARPSVNESGLLNMTNRFDLSQLTNAMVSATVLANLTNALSNSIPSLTNTADTNAYMMPSGLIVPAAWCTNVSVKIAAIAANIRAQASTNEISVSTPYGEVVGKKARPEVTKLMIKTVTQFVSYENPWLYSIINLYIAPMVWSPAGGTGNFSMKLAFTALATISIDPPNKIISTNFPASTITNIPVTSYLSPKEYPIQIGNVEAHLQKNHTQRMYSSLGQIAIGLGTNSAGSSFYSSFGTNSTVNNPISVVFANASSTNSIVTPDLGITETNYYVIDVLDPRTIRGAGGTTNLSTNLPSWSSHPPYPNSVTDTNPVILERPYVSVGELGVVFRDQPWRSLDFVSGPSSFDRNLLDAFSAYGTPANGVRCGVVNLNTGHPEVIAALLSGTPTTGSGTISPATASTYAASMVDSTSVSPLTNRAQLVDFVYSCIIATPGDTQKLSREAAVRALAESGQTRTWNLLIDVVAQDGKFTGSPATAANFNVSGERRVWVSVAIDRLTGRVIAIQTEEVNQ
ncbi:MAG: hypothetical protein K8R38_06760 [Verrucomicrobia bacterium]|nr:hypothetical protein [Verrucomicrobiota bacterium]